MRQIRLIIAALLLTPFAANADVIAFDTFGPGDSFASGTYGVDGNSAFQAFQFTAAVSGSLSDITVALGRNTDLTTATRFQLFTDAGDALGILLETIDVANNVAPSAVSPFFGDVVTFSSILNPMLNAGQTYWLSYSEPNAADASSSLWFFNDQGTNGLRVTSILDPAMNVLPAFRIEVVPEPATLALLGISLFGMGLARRRKKA